MWWNERFSPTVSTLRSEQDCNVYNCPRSKSESATFGSCFGTIELLVSYYVAVHCYMPWHHQVYFHFLEILIIPLHLSELSRNQVTFSYLSQAALLIPFRFLLPSPADDDAADHSGCPASSVPSVKEKSGIRSRSCTWWFSLAVRIKSSKPTARLLFPLPTFRMSCIRLIARTFK